MKGSIQFKPKHNPENTNRSSMFAFDFKRCKLSYARSISRPKTSFSILNASGSFSASYLVTLAALVHSKPSQTLNNRIQYYSPVRY